MQLRHSELVLICRGERERCLSIGSAKGFLKQSSDCATFVDYVFEFVSFCYAAQGQCYAIAFISAPGFPVLILELLKEMS